jgi:hypothetical protein
MQCWLTSSCLLAGRPSCFFTLPPPLVTHLTPLQKQESISVTAGVAAPTDLTGQMAAALVAGTLALRSFGSMSNADAAETLRIAIRLYGVTMSTKGVLIHNRNLWKSDSFYDDRLWAVRFPPRRPLLGSRSRCWAVHRVHRAVLCGLVATFLPGRAIPLF